MSIVTRLTMIVAMCVVLPACSSNMTRFDPPSLGMKQSGISEDTPINGNRAQRENAGRNYAQQDQYSDRSYAKPDYRQSQYNRDFKQSDYQNSANRYNSNRGQYNNSGRNNYEDYRKQYTQKQYAENQYSQNRFNNNRDGYQPKKIYKEYSDRDVYDTKSTPDNRRAYDNRFQNRDGYGQNSYQREQLPELQQSQRREEGRDQPTRKVTTYRYVPQNARKESDYQQPRRQQQASKKFVEHRVVKGDTLYNISKRYNVNQEDIRRENNIDGSGIKLGQRLRIPGASQQNVDQYSQKTVEKRTAIASLKPGDSYRVKSGDTVYNIARRAGVSPQELADANGLDNVGQVKLGQELVIPGKQAKKRPVRVASIDRKAGLSNLDKKSAKAPVPVRKKVVSQNKIKSVDTGVAKPLAGSHRFMWPVGGRIVSKFGRQKSGTINDGVNLSVPVGTKVKAAEGGTVAYAGSELKGYGNLILVRHKNNWVSAYAHNSKLLVKRGDKVSRGQVIAKSGKSGTVTQPQLHFELRKGSKPVNPMKYLALR
ncbi:MAG: peptidoglycan DD-metalloendopeptidase family protein [Rhizobiales bacterium]|nr:peptidoglycan DD-metalloendopeptidase family protein [Hyphomicrobiales bacterium]